jgi:hypothetical protein
MHTPSVRCGISCVLSVIVTIQIVEHKQQLILEAKRRKAMDLHLEFIVDQTAKYSDWLAQGLGNGPGNTGLSLPSSTPSQHG